MPPAAQLSRIVLAAGLPARFLYWTGASGRRYLFTCTGSDALADFEAGLAIAVSNGEIIWIGEVAALARMPADSRERRAAIYVHFLATTLAERRAAAADLRPVERVPLRLAA